jgi:aryl-alcohol dehydrogenase-like predicted oxidoreductase
MVHDMARRTFIKLASSAGVALASGCATSKTNTGVSPEPTVPRRRFGRSGITVSKLCLGGSSVMGTDGRTLLDQALRYGIDAWEFNPFTGPVFGDYFQSHPGVRDRVFLSAKARSPKLAIMQEDLDGALATNKTGTIDFFAVHGIDDVSVLDDDVRHWAAEAKHAGKIRFFGFCTHKRVAPCLEAAAGLGWIDGIQAFYNYRIQALSSCEAGLQKCHANGIALFTVKSMALGVRSEPEMQDADSWHQLQTLLANHGMTLAQAKLQSLWQNQHVTSVCSLMPTPAILRANALAASDEHPLPVEVTNALAAHAEASGRSFCRRCGTCDGATPEGIPVFTVMESLMYGRGYGSKDLATKILTQIPSELRAKLGTADFSQAEALCPQKMPIAELMKEAQHLLGP